MKAIFPASYSTLCSEALAGLLSAKYLSERMQCKLIVRGVGDSYLVQTADSRFIFRVYRSSHRNLQQIRSELVLLTALKEAGVSVSYPLPDREGKMIQELEAAEGPRYGVLFSFANGNSPTVLSRSQLYNLGSEMARFHTISATIDLGDSRWTFDADTTLIQPLIMAKEAFAENNEGYKWLLKAAEHAQAQITQLNAGSFPSGYCHFDLLPKNFHIDQNDKITFFDFDFFGYGWLINDLMVFWQYLSMEVLFNRISQEEADKNFNVFLQGYRQHRPVTEDELAAMPYLSLGFWLFYMGFHTTHDQFYPLVFQPAQLEMRTDFIKRLMERYWKI